MSIRSKARNWCFTLNNPTIDETQIAEALQEAGSLVYAIYQLEQGENGTVHFQGYVMFQDQEYLQPTLKNCLPTAHWEVAKGTPMQNKIYCSKPETRLTPPCELGIFPETSQGRRTDLEGLKKHFNLDSLNINMQRTTSRYSSSTLTSSNTGTKRLFNPASQLMDLNASSSMEKPEPVNPLSLNTSLPKEEWSLSDTASEDSGMDISDSEESSSTIFEAATYLMETLRELSTNSPFELTLNALHVSWRPTNSTSRPISRRMNGGLKK